MSYRGSYDSVRLSSIGYKPLIAGVLVLAAIIGLWAFIFGYWVNITSRQGRWITRIFLQGGFFPSLLPTHWTWILWLCLAIVAFLVSMTVRRSRKLLPGILSFVLLTLAVVVFCFNINDHSGSFAGATTFEVESLNKMPASLKWLNQDASADTNGCARYAYHDMPGCINQEALNFDWDPRTSSATGAGIVMTQTSGGVSNTTLLSDTLVYVYGDGDKGEWTAIIDGTSRQPIYGIASWNGRASKAQVCTFSGNYELDKAFDGRWGRNLSDDIASKFPGLFYDDSDRYGYCDGDQPIIVIPVKSQVAYRHRTTFRAAGVLVIKGSKSGVPVYDYVPIVKPGDFPGPVYPASLAKEQRESMGMIAGILNNTSRHFGYDEVSVASQSSNASEYLLRDNKTDRLYWVTPMKPRGSDNEVLVAYSVVPADTASTGSLNKQKIYILPDGDPRAVSISTLEASTRNALQRADSGFFSAGGTLAEFLPLDDETWQVYAELSGRVVYRITVPIDSSVAPTVTSLNQGNVATGTTTTGPGSSTTTTTGSACTPNLKSLSDKALAQCTADVGKEWQRRHP